MKRIIGEWVWRVVMVCALAWIGLELHGLREDLAQPVAVKAASTSCDSDSEIRRKRSLQRTWRPPHPDEITPVSARHQPRLSRPVSARAGPDPTFEGAHLIAWHLGRTWWRSTGRARFAGPWSCAAEISARW